jgi:hypothetical protein
MTIPKPRGSEATVGVRFLHVTFGSTRLRGRSTPSRRTLSERPQGHTIRSADFRAEHRYTFEGKPLPGAKTPLIAAGATCLYSTTDDILRWLTWHADRSSSSQAEVRLQDQDGKPALIKEPKVEFIDDSPGTAAL